MLAMASHQSTVLLTAAAILFVLQPQRNGKLYPSVDSRWLVRFVVFTVSWLVGLHFDLQLVVLEFRNEGPGTDA
jgi:hypothetical protein